MNKNTQPNETARELRTNSLISLAMHEAEPDEAAQLWDTVFSNITVGEFRLAETAMRMVYMRYFEDHQ